MARPERVELPTFWFVARRSIQLSYGRIRLKTAWNGDTTQKLYHRRAVRPPTGASKVKAAGSKKTQRPAATNWYSKHGAALFSQFFFQSCEKTDHFGGSAQVIARVRGAIVTDSNCDLAR